jgi:hypothetical protein
MARVTSVICSPLMMPRRLLRGNFYGGKHNDATRNAVRVSGSCSYSVRLRGRNLVRREVVTNFVCHVRCRRQSTAGTS